MYERSDIGMNQWGDRAIAYPDTPINRRQDPLGSRFREMHGKWGRYLDIESGCVPYRTVPGKPILKAYFRSRSGHDEFAELFGGVPGIRA